MPSTFEDRSLGDINENPLKINEVMPKMNQTLGGFGINIKKGHLERSKNILNQD